ncbi:MAG: ribonuclease J, partial [Dehalococcoidia bacterium]
RQGVFLLLADSTYAELPGYTPSEAVVGEALHRAIGEAPGRVMIATFASLISRVQQVLTAAARYGRKVAIVGRSMVDNVNIATKMGYLTPPEGVLVPLEQAKRLPPEQVVLVTTGSQGEPTSALVRIANRGHREIQIIPGDTVIISATPIPGNETVVSRTINNLFRQGARVLYDKVATVHVHGHASQEELKLMLNLTRPRFFVPVHGEYRHLVVHAQLAQSLGVPRENTFVLEDGQVLDLTAKGGGVVERIPAGHIYVDGTHTREAKSQGIREKKPPAEDGVLVIVIAWDRKTGRLSRPPEVISSGLVDQEQELPLTNAVAHLVMSTLDHEGPPLDWSLVNSKVKESVGNYLYKELGRRPMIVPVALEV